LARKYLGISGISKLITELLQSTVNCRAMKRRPVMCYWSTARYWCDQCKTYITIEV